MVAGALPITHHGRTEIANAICLARFRGELDDIGLEEALAEYERLGNPFEAARTREYLAQALPAEARAPVLAAALREYEQLGATPYAESLRSAEVTGRA